MIELKKCPFCGGEASMGENEYYDGANTFYVYCKNCDVRMPTRIRTDEAATAWNRRAQPENEALTLEELRGMDGEPVYVIRVSGAKIKMWVIACPNEHGLTQTRNADSQFMAWSTYGKVWLAYRTKPERSEG